MAGGERIEGTLFGNGERTGNLDIATMALNLYTQGIDPGLDFSNVKEIRRVAEFCTELPVHERHPYAGDLVFTAFSGSHQDAIKKGFDALEKTGQDLFEVPYLTIDPADIGRQYDPVIRVNSQSGKGGVAFLVEKELGFRLPRPLQIEFSKTIQGITEETGRELPAREIGARFMAEYVKPPETLKYLAHTSVERAEDEDLERFRFKVEFKKTEHEVFGEGNGPLDAFVAAVKNQFGLAFDIKDFQEHAMEAGSGSAAAAYVLVQDSQGADIYGVGQSKSITKASLLALVAAINRSLAS